MKKYKISEIKDYRMKLMLGLVTFPMPNSTEKERKFARIGAIYVLGKILGMPEKEGLD